MNDQPPFTPQLAAVANEMTDTHEPALALQGVSKIYRLFKKPIYRLLDTFGLCPNTAGFYTEHVALDDVYLHVNRGEKVAIIGRNGAGKSTLLKIITRTITPTRGQLEVFGEISALLQIGTGFHSDFTGRQNIFASLAHLGITGKQAEEKFAEAVDFAELEQYIDQPMKTYSTGMAARLMFAVSSSLEPDILVLDEVLGVGDAYFAHKCFERMRVLCSGHGTTLLLVTHDIYTAQSLCNRFIWIERGRIREDGDAKTVVAAYERSIKEQEEERLRQQNAALRRQTQQHYAGLRVRVSSRNGFALPAPLALQALEIGYRDGTRLTLDAAAGSPQWTLLPEGNLGPVEEVDGRPCRVLRPYGAIYHKAEWSISIPHDGEVDFLRVAYRYTGSLPAYVCLSTDAGRILCDGELPAAAAWTEARIEDSQNLAVSLERVGRYGNGRMIVEDIALLDRTGAPVNQLARGADATFRLRLTVKDPQVDRAVTMQISFHRSGTAYCSRQVWDRLELPAGADSVEVDMHFRPLLLGSALYHVSIMIYEPGYLIEKRENAYTPFFTLNPRLHCALVRGFEFQISEVHPMDPMTLFYHPAQVEARLSSPG